MKHKKNIFTKFGKGKERKEKKKRKEKKRRKKKYLMHLLINTNS